MAIFTEAEYRTLLSTMVAADVDPVLTPAELNLLLKLNRLEDEGGLAPTDTDWDPTYDLDRAALEGWRWKLGKASDLSVARTGDLTLEDNAIVRNITGMIEQYRRRVNGSIQPGVSGVTASDTAIDEEA